MKEKAAGIFSSILIAVFVNFVFANTVFLHTHQGLSGRLIIHSHPYSHSSSNHGHTSQSLDQVSAFNAAASAIEGSVAPVISAAPGVFAEMEVPRCVGIAVVDIPVADVRGPPCAC
ncbi:MAG: hypothetical protein K2G30_07075 [Muribaculaceae bacterium]|nr:hypothetical protein [Muribaculaceae bacterium]MDE7142782.1 hypothetical protein [Muribaculaceae bacterium]